MKPGTPSALKKLSLPFCIRITSKDQFNEANRIRLEAGKIDKKAELEAQNDVRYQQKREKHKAKHKH